MEEWRPVKGYEGLYEISSIGRVRSLGKYFKERHFGKDVIKYSPPRISKFVTDKYGYYKLGLIKDGRNIHHHVHRLVAQAFIDNPENKTQVNHKNGIKTDNRVENLEWCTPKENTIHAHKTGLCGINGASKPVAKLDEEGNILQVFESARKAELSIGKNGKSSNLAKVCRQGYGHCGGFKWKWISREEYFSLKNKLSLISR